MRDVPRSRARPTGVCFSGGGSRAFVAALGQLEALRQMGLITSVDHIAGVSGGGWASAVHCWSDDDAVPTLLLPPEELDWRALRNIPPAPEGPHLSICRASIPRYFLRALTLRGLPVYEAWRRAIHQVLLRPLGMPETAPLSQPCATGVPMPLLGAAILGTPQAAPFDVAQRSFRCLEMTPTTIGPPGGGCRRPGTDDDRSMTPLDASSVRSPRGGRQARRDARAPDARQAPPFTLADALAVSSFFPAAPLVTSAAASAAAPSLAELDAPVLSRRRRALQRVRDATQGVRASVASLLQQFAAARCSCTLPLPIDLSTPREQQQERPSPGDATRGDEVLLADGGSVANLPLPLLLSRDVRRCLCVLNVGERLPTAEQWDPHAQPLPSLPVSEDLAALFGVLRPSPNPSKDLARAQCFETKNYAPLVSQLQAAAARGR